MKIILSSEVTVEEGMQQAVSPFQERPDTLPRGSKVAVNPERGLNAFYFKSPFGFLTSITKSKVYAVLLENKQEEEKWLQLLQESDFKVVLPGEPEPDLPGEPEPEFKSKFDLKGILYSIILLILLFSFIVGLFFN
ncbi:MAG: hypothetical protein HC877_07560 [Thioploca sp.]|nr:hypothetical protein [Thioploca sp.]